jgi:uncharacterized phage protein gp47/JayE
VSDYITLPIDTDPEDLIATTIETLQTKFPDWEPADGNLDYWLIQTIAMAAAENRDVASAVPESIFRWFGNTVMGIPPIDATSASTTTTWTMMDNQGYTIPAGTQVGIALSGDETIPFYTQNDVVVPPGSTQTAAGEVIIVALVPGAAASGLGSAGGSVQLLDPLVYVKTVTMVDLTAGGLDAEADSDYLNRLTAEMTLLAPRPILPSDFAVMARGVPGVARATVLDGYNPANSTSNNERMVTVASVDTLGNPVSVPVRGQVQQTLDSKREVTFVVNVMDPTYTIIDVNYTVKVLATFDPTDIIARTNDALTQYLSPANWGGDFFSTGVISEETWMNQTMVRYLEVSQVINNVTGVDYITLLQLRVSGGTFASSDVTLTGAIPLPRPGAITGTAT